MEDSAFSQEFFEFIHSAVPSVSVAELLLLVFKEPERWWTVADIRSELPPDVNLTEGAIASGLDDLRAKGIVEYDAEKRARYRPSEPLARHVQTLAQAYNERPVTLIRMIYALRDSRIQSFADAFKFWKK